VNVSLCGKLHKKNCGNSKEADGLFKLVLKAKEDPTDENIKAIKCYLNEKLRVAFLVGLESDVDSGEVYLSGFNTPIPTTLVQVIKDYYENEYPLEAIINFWKLLMINPDTRVRKSLFDFIAAHDFVLTDKGYMIVYKAVYYKEDEKKSPLAEFVSNQYLHVKKDWSCSPNKYTVYEDNESGKLAITKNETAKNWGVENNGVDSDLNINVLGKLGDLYDSIFDGSEENDEQAIYTDMYSRRMRIVLGQPVKMDRKECDSDPQKDCSYGLHCGATGYVNDYASSTQDGRGVVLACYVNPANVVAVPTADCTKMRVTEYFPFAIATYEDGKIDIIEQSYFESDYQSYEEAELEAQIAKIKSSELPIEKAKNAEEEQRPLFELQKILETRLLDLTV
jgi:hypothetical protein